MESKINIHGTVEHIIYYNPSNNYFIFSISDDSKNVKEDIVCTCYIENLYEGENINLTGNYTTHPVYGKQFNAVSYEKSIPTSLEGIEKYLSSGVIKGLGEVLAKRIVSKFKDDTLKIIENSPEKLSNIKGISLEKAKNIGEIFNEQVGLRRVMLYLQNYGISSNFAIKLFKKYKNETIEVINKNPYILVNDISGIGFKTADQIAFKLGVGIESDERIEAGLKYYLNISLNNGHTCLPKIILEDRLKELLNIDKNLIENIIIKSELKREIIQEKIFNKEIIYLNKYYYAENYVAKKILELSNTIEEEDTIDEQISNVEKETNIILAENQKKAVKEALTRGVLIITGGPGTGKTTIINIILKLLKNQDLEVELCAPTGRASKRMAESTGFESKTIHRLLGLNSETENYMQGMERNEDNPIEADVIIVDESSMIDLMLMHSLLKAISEGTRLILVGDVDQLPSVGAGNVLKDIINSECIKTIYLTEIFRQGQESAIITNAHKINKGIYPILNVKEKDFFFIQKKNINDVINIILDLVDRRIPNFLKCNKVRDIQVLTPMRKSQLGINNLNNLLQEKLNPRAKNKQEYIFRGTIFRQGDKVMQIKNNYSTPWLVYDNVHKKLDEGLGVFNGDEGIIKNIYIDEELMEVEFYNNKTVYYNFSQLDEINLSYALTIHKSQGSEYKVVIIPIHSGPYMLFTRNLLYTAVTRGKELVVIVGLKETLFKMIDNNREILRYSYLSFRIKKFAEFLNDK